MTWRLQPGLDTPTPSPMLVRSCIFGKTPSTSIGDFEDVFTDIQNTLVASYNSMSTVYDSPSFHKRHDRPNSSDYARRYRQTPPTHAPVDGQRWRTRRHISTRQRVATEKQTNRKHRRDGRITQPTAWKLIGLVGYLRWL